MKVLKLIFPVIFLLFSMTVDAQSTGERTDDQASQFTGNFKMIISAYKKDKLEKNSPMEMEMHVKPGTVVMTTALPDVPATKMMLDYEANKLLIITDMGGTMQGIKMKMPKTASDTDYGDKKMNIVKTGNTKTIDGYFCEEFEITYEEEDGVTNSWVTKDLDISWEDFAQSMQMFGSRNKNANFSGLEGYEGFAIESVHVSSNGKEKTVIKVKDINIGTVNESIFETSGVNFITMPSFGN